MASKYKVIGKPKHWGKPAEPGHKPDYLVSDEALKLAEDIQTIELVMELLGRLDTRTINDGRNESGTTIRSLHFVLMACRNNARDKLRCDYLAGRPPIQRPKSQTLADVWEILKASLDEIRANPAP